MNGLILERAEALLAQAVNRILSLDAGTKQRLKMLNGRTIALTWDDRDKQVYALIENGTAQLKWTHDGPIDVTMSGSPADFLALARANRRGESIAAGRIEITGDLAVAQDVQALLNALDIDWEQGLAEYIGEVPAHHVGRVSRLAGGGISDSYNRFEQELSDYLVHETNAVPQRNEVLAQRQAIYGLADDVERSAARVQRLLQRKQRT